MPNAQHVPYENFVRLQLMLGETLDDVSSLCRKIGVARPSLEMLGDIRSDLLDSLPKAIQEEAVLEGLSKEFIEKYIYELKTANWPYLQCLLQFATRQMDFDNSWEFFINPELRLRLDCLIVSQRCDPRRVAEALAGWSKYGMETSSVEVYSYFFCNMEAMKSFSNWQKFFQDIPDETQKFFMCQAYDVQTDADLLVLTNDLSVRAAMAASPEDTVRDLMSMAFVQIKKEEQKIKRGIPARNTAIFEWSSVFCGMYDRVQKSIEAGGNENSLENVRTKLVRLRRRNIRRIDEFEIAQPDGPKGEAA